MSKSVPINLIQDPIVSTLKRMTIPMVFSMIILTSFNLVDTFFVSLLGTEPLAALSFTFPITFTVISLAIGLGIGTSAVIGRVMGSGEVEEAKKDGTGAIILSFIMVSIISILGYLITDPLFTLLGAEAQMLPLIHDYMDIWYMGSVFLVCPIVGNSVMRAFGDTKTPSMIMGLGAVINAILDPLLIFGLGPIPAMGIQGAALATLIAWTICFGLVIHILLNKKKIILASFGSLASFTGTSRKILKIGLPAAGANMLTPVAAAIMTAIVASFGTSAVGAFGVGVRIEGIASLVVLALSMSLPPFISQNYGAGQLDRVMAAYRLVLKFVIFWQLFVYCLLVLGAGWIAAAFSTDQQVMELVKWFIWILPLGYGLQGVIILSNSAFNALHLPMSALVMSVVRLFVFYVPLAYLGSRIAGMQGLFIGALIGNLITAILAYRWFTKQVLRLSVSTKEVTCES